MSMDIKKWCAKLDSRKYLEIPFNYGGRTFACNGHVMISITEEAGHPDIEESLIKAMIVFLDTDSFTFAPLSPNLKLPEATKCETCKGTKKVTSIQCDECEGDGEVEFDNEHNSYSCECKTCDGSGHETTIGVGNDCHECLGYGTSHKRFDHTEIDGATINAQYARLLSAIENVEVSNQDNKLYFRAGDVKGVILGMRT